MNDNELTFKGDGISQKFRYIIATCQFTQVFGFYFDDSPNAHRILDDLGKFQKLEFSLISYISRLMPASLRRPDGIVLGI